MACIPHPSDIFQAYGAACAWGSLLELKTRMLADNTPALKHLAHANKLEDVESAIAAAFASQLQPGDAALLAKARLVRNKVVHGNFSRAKETLIELGFGVSDGGVSRIDASGNILDALVNGKRVPVSQVPTVDSNIFGWLLEAGTSGLFERAVEVFQNAGEIIQRLHQGQTPSYPSGAD